MLTFNANGTFTYTHDNGTDNTDSFTYKVSDGQGQSSTATVSITIYTACTPYTTSTCNTVPVTYNPNFCLSFNAPAGGLAGTGFTMVDTHTVNKYPTTPSVPALPGYEPANIALTGGRLVLTTTRGSFKQTQAQGTGNNTQVNALGVGVSVTGLTTITAQLINPTFLDATPDTSNGEQAGIWFGLNEDNHIKFAVTNENGADAGGIELGVESGGVLTNTNMAVSNISTAIFTLELRLDPINNRVTGKYVSSTGQTGILGPLTVPASFFAGQLLADGTTTTSFAGLYATSRFNATTPAMPLTFDNFCIQPNPDQAPVGTADSMTVAKGTAQTVLDSGATSVLSNDTDAEGDPLTAVLVTGPVNGLLTLNANGTFTYTHNNSATTTDSFTYKVNDGQRDSAPVTVSINIYLCGLYANHHQPV
jgi:VCBS repeat-containing protein